MSEGNVIGEFGVDILEACKACHVVRFGNPRQECPNCGETDVILLKLNEPPEHAEQYTDG